MSRENSQPIIVVGGGQAAAAAIARMRELDKDIPITLIGDENVLPYQRPPLSKAYLAGTMPLERLIFRPRQWFDDNAVTLRLGERVESLHPQERQVVLYNGETLCYSKLLLATGSTPRLLPAEMGGALGNVYALRSVSDADSLRPAVEGGGRLVIVGGGYIGLEVAAVARKTGLAVTLVEMGERILQRVAAPETSDFYRHLHGEHGVTLIEGAGLARLHGNGVVKEAELTDGTRLPADAVLMGIGVLPGSELAELAGLNIENGIAVDEHCRTSDPHIFAAGDCANFPHHGARVRLESVPNAIGQGEVAAANMLEHVTPYRATPWFWSDQYDVKLQIAGLNTGYDKTIVRPGRRDGAQSVWYYGGETLLAVDAMNDAPSFMMARKALEAGVSIPAHVAADPAANLKEWVG
ncbi:MAG: FAD-dependent oxidoreductase [Pseudomonadota bacterium]